MKVRHGIVVVALAVGAATGVVTVNASGATASGSATSMQASHALPAWFHWTWASKAARADCHGGPAIIVWVGDSDQSALVCKKNAAIWPS